MRSLFSVLPENFFVPLASPNRVHYGSSLLIFYRLFQEQTGGVERSILVSKIAEYLAQQDAPLIEEVSLTEQQQVEPDLEFDMEVDEGDGESTDLEEGGRDPLRAAASRILRRLIEYGWLGEEILTDYTRMITITAHAKPFFEALLNTEEGSRTEYESHIVAIYSSICSDVAKENGHYAVLNAHEHLSRLIDSLKVLSQNIRSHYELLLSQSGDTEIPEILRLHYDQYLQEVVDRAYMRLKTSDNLSRYRPRIIQTINSFLEDEAWLGSTATALGLLRRENTQEARKRLTWMLEDIRDQLRLLDPLVKDIDTRNMLYARSSMESIKSRIRSDVTVAGRITVLCKALASKLLWSVKVEHHLHKLHWSGEESLYLRNQRAGSSGVFEHRPLRDTLILEKEEAELRLRLQKQLSPQKITRWLEEQLADRDFAWAHELARDQSSFIRTLYATLYGEGQVVHFPFRVIWEDELVMAAGWEFRKHGYRRL
jgi:hypothetical protein